MSNQFDPKQFDGPNFDTEVKKLSLEPSEVGEAILRSTMLNAAIEELTNFVQDLSGGEDLTARQYDQIRYAAGFSYRSGATERVAADIREHLKADIEYSRLKAAPDAWQPTEEDIEPIVSLVQTIADLSERDVVPAYQPSKFNTRHELSESPTTQYNKYGHPIPDHKLSQQ